MTQVRYCPWTRTLDLRAVVLLLSGVKQLTKKVQAHPAQVLKAGLVQRASETLPQHTMLHAV